MENLKSEIKKVLQMVFYSIILTTYFSGNVMEISSIIENKWN